MSSPSTLTLSLLNSRTGDRINIENVRCGTSLDRAELFALISLIESHVRATKPDMLDWLATRRHDSGTA